MQDLIVDAKKAHDEFLNAKDRRARKIAKGDYEVKFTRLRLLLSEHPEMLNAKLNEMQHTPLHFCALFGNLDTALLLLEHGAIVDVQDEFGQSAFNCAMIKKNYDIARLLLDHNADIDRLNTNHMTQLFLTVGYASNSDMSEEKQEHYLKLTKRLLRLGANCQIGDRVDTPLQHAARRFCSPKLFTLLLDYGAGIGCNFNRLYRIIDDKDRFQQLLEIVTENQIVIFSRHNQWKLNKTAITSIEALDQAVKEGKQFNFKGLVRTVTKMLSSGLVYEDDIAQYTQLLDKLKQYKLAQDARHARQASLFKQTLRYVAKHLQDDTVDCKISPSQIEQLPDEVQEKLAKEQIKLLRLSRANKGQ